ncbi:protein containing Bacterial alpha-L-rhamnosidase domain protein, partial [human gut metagenome]
HLNTGFLSTPFLCDVLAKYGYADTAYKLLLQPDAPGWLYEVGRAPRPFGKPGRALTKTASRTNP